jgi:hypothetical protein
VAQHEELDVLSGRGANHTPRRSSTASSYFALNGTDHRTHAEQNAAIAAYARWHNTHAQPKADFAVGSPIRSWTPYPVKAA